MEYIKIGSIVRKISSGGTPKSTKKEFYGGNIPWLNTKEINFNRIYKTEKSITEDGLNNSSAKYIKENCVIVAMYGATAGRVAINKIPLTTNQACCNIEVDENKIDYNYLYYAIKNDYERLASFANGGAQQNLNSVIIKEFEIPYFDIKTQKKISKILTNIDKKIELNNEINNNLQEFARSQFNERFSIKVANAKFKDLVNFKKKTVKSSNKNPDLGYYPIDVLPMNYLVTKDCKPNEDANSSLLEFSKYDILLGSMRVYFHRVCLAANNGITRNTTFVFEPKLKEQLYYSLLLIDRNDFIEYANRTSKGSTMPYAAWESLAEYDIYLPTLEETKEFYELMYPIFEKMISNEAENRTLAQLRDSLLPKLMNGEIELDNIEI